MAAKLITQAQVTVTTAGTRVQISSTQTPVYSVVFSAPAANSGAIYIGDSNVAAGRGVEMAKGTSFTISGDVTSRSGQEELFLSDFYVDAATSGDKVNVSYVTRR
jgi:hypothetical protein